MTKELDSTFYINTTTNSVTFWSPIQPSIAPEREINLFFCKKFAYDYFFGKKFAYDKLFFRKFLESDPAERILSILDFWKKKLGTAGSNLPRLFENQFNSILEDSYLVSVQFTSFN